MVERPDDLTNFITYTSVDHEPTVGRGKGTVRYGIYVRHTTRDTLRWSQRQDRTKSGRKHRWFKSTSHSIQTRTPTGQPERIHTSGSNGKISTGPLGGGFCSRTPFPYSLSTNTEYRLQIQFLLPLTPGFNPPTQCPGTPLTIKFSGERAGRNSKVE